MTLDPEAAETLVELLERRARQHPDRPFLHYLERGETITAAHSYGAVHARASTIARELAQRFSPGDRALLLYANDPEYVAAFFGCLYAGVIAVPVYPPASARPQHLARLRSVAQSARPSGVLCTAQVGRLLERAQLHVELGAVVATDALETSPSLDGAPRRASPEEIAFLQYTSGSTAMPKGVRVSHGNLIANSRAIREVFGMSREDRFASWLPLFHDMGLIGMLIQPLFSGTDLFLFSPLRFIESPLRWLRVIAEHGVTLSGGPTFAFRMCNERVADERLEGLDLSKWRVAFCGSEPICSQTLRAFASKLAPFGFDARALYPCYGLAEATLLVSGGVRGAGLHWAGFDREQLALDRARQVASGKPIVDCGRPAAGHEVQIVDPHSLACCPDGRVGEIWVSGPSVALGYWGNAEATRATFVERAGTRWLRTGDLGFIHDGALFVSGRLKDLIIVRGRNLYPQDLEGALEDRALGLTAGRVAVFAVDTEVGEALGVAAEVGRRVRARVEPSALVRSMAEVLTEEAGEPPALVLLLASRALPVTSSGKLRRSGCLSEYRAGNLRPFFVHDAAAADAQRMGSGPGALADIGAAARDVQTETERALLPIVCDVLAVDHIVPEDNFFSLGASSLALVSLLSRIREDLDVELAPIAAYEHPTLRALAEHIDRAGGAAGVPSASIARVDRAGRLPLSRAEERLWVMWQLDPDSAAYTLTLTAPLLGPLDPSALEQALSLLVERHEILRTTFHHDAKGRFRRIHPPCVIEIARHDALALGERERGERVRHLVREAATAAFDLERGPLLRAAVVCLSDAEHRLIVSAHHIVVDGGSLDVLLAEWLSLYAQQLGSTTRLPELSLQYADYAAYEREERTDPAAEHDRKLVFWRACLGGDQSPLSLPYDRARPVRRSDHAEQHAFRFGSARTTALRGFARAHETTVFTVLLAVLHAVLHRLSGAGRTRVGVPYHGRELAGLETMVGFFVDTLPSAIEVVPSESFGELLARVKTGLMEAHAHALPFSAIVDGLGVERSSSHSPLVQVMCNHLISVTPPSISDAGLTVGPLERPAFRTELDLALDTIDEGEDLASVITFATDLFDRETIARMAGQLVRVLDAALADPSTTVAGLPLLAPVERQRRIEDSRGAHAPRDAHLTLPEAFVRVARTTPEAVALRDGSCRYSYAELDRRTDRVARRLRRLGVGPEQVVGLCSARSSDAVIAVIGILKAGGAYCPLDPALPQARIADCLRGVAARVALADRAGCEALARSSQQTLLLEELLWDGDDALEPEPLRHDLLPSNLAYCLFTSGSTGAPKGVLVTHGSVLNHAAWMRAALGADAAARVLHYAPLGFDASVCELWLPLLHGGTCIVATADPRDPESFLTEVARCEPTLLQGVPSLLSALLDHPRGPAVLGAVPCLVSGGEALSVDLSQRLGSSSDRRVYNLYGPTETTVDATFARCSAHRAVSTEPIGRPIANASAYVLDSRLEPVPAGVIGELYVGGAGLARGYAAAPGLTADCFVPDPFADASGARLYRTGDLARVRPDGALEFVGRGDGQVKHNGYRIELGEVESAVRAHRAVREAAALLRRDVGGVVVYVAVDPEDHASGSSAVIEQIRELVAGRLPNFMRPRAYVEIPALPLLPSGKIDVRALPAPITAATAMDRVAPRNETERALGAIWEAVLRVSEISVHDNFFSLGGDSIDAISIAGRARERGLALAPADIFEHQTLAALARAARRLPSAMPAAEAAVDRLQATLPDEVRALSPFPEGEIEDAFPLSPMQQGMLLHSVLEAGSGIYVMQDVYRLESAIDPQAFVRAWQRVVARHPALRVSFLQTPAGPFQLVHRDLPTAVEYQDLRGQSAEQQRAQIDGLLAEERRSGFDLAKPPLIKLRLVRVGEASYRYIESHHHILMDDWCRSLLLMDFFAEYHGELAGRPRQPSQTASYRVFIDWLATRDQAESLAYFREQLTGVDTVTPLGIERVAPRHGGALEVASCESVLSETATAQLAEAARGMQVTVNTLAQGAWAVLLSQYAGARDVVFGVTVAGRPPELPGSDEIVGIFVNSVPLRVRLPTPGSRERVGAWLRSLQAQNATLRKHEHTALTDIQSCTSIPAGEPLFRSLFVFENAPLDPSLFDRALELQIELDSNRTHTNYPITVVVVPGRRLKLMLSYDERLFAASDLERMLEHFERVLAALARGAESSVGALPRLSHEEEARLLVELNRTRVAHDLDAGYAALFARSVAHHGDRMAARYGTDQASYRELERRSAQCAAALHARGAGPEVLVAVLADRGLDWLVAILGAIRVGAAFLPLDPSLPEARLARLMTSAGVRLAVADTSGRAVLQRCAPLLAEPVESVDPARACTDPAPPEAAALPRDALAYVIYTSGSTGEPKAAQVTSAGMLNNQLSKIPLLQLGERDVLAQTAGSSFDIFVWQLLTGLLCGARVEIVPDDVCRDPARLLRYARDTGVTVLQSVPSMISAMLEGEPVALPELRFMLPTGEALGAELAREWFSAYPGVPLVNAFGPAECADDVALHVVDAPPAPSQDRVPIGRPTDNTELYVLDGTLAPVPPGVTGELWVSGVGVGRGYLGDPAATAQTFVPNPFSRLAGARLYRTGDLVRHRSDGTLEFIGRCDAQVKLRGQRVELGEIEARLAELDAIADAAVVVSDEGPAGKQLVAYVVPADGDRAGTAALAERIEDALRAELPAHMVPQRYAVLESLPRTANGKLDRRALPAPEPLRRGARVAPEGELETALLAIISDVLGIADAGVTDDFFALGGHSLLLTRVAARIGTELQLDVPLAMLFERSSVRALARELARRKDPGEADELAVMAELLSEFEAGDG